jgi:hypothetical protein
LPHLEEARQRRLEGCATGPNDFFSSLLERIVIGRNRGAVSSDHVNPLYINRIDQIHTVDGSPKAIPFDRDLI